MRTLTLTLLGVGLLCTFASGQSKETTQAKPQTIGQITAVFGEAKIESNDRARSADVFSTFRDDERVSTGDAGLSLVLRTRLVAKLDAFTSVKITESAGQTHVQLEGGAVQVFVGRRAAYMGDAGVQDPLVRLDGKEAVFLASYDRDARSGYYACEHGTLIIESAADHSRQTLGADQQAIAAEGKPLQISALDRETYNRHQRTLQRLGQSVVAQGSETQRTRSTALDTRNALAQLEAAGWIDRKTLVGARPLTQQTSDETQTSKTTQNQIAAHTGSSESASASSETPAADTSAPVETPAAIEPSNSPPVQAPVDPPSAPSGGPSEPVAAPSAPLAEVPAPRDSSVAAAPQVEVEVDLDTAETSVKDNHASVPSATKIDNSNDLPKVKAPKNEKFDPQDDSGPKVPKPEKIAKNDGPGQDLPDLKIPKVDKSNRGHGDELKDVKDLAKRTREQVEKTDKHGKGGKKDD